jgi:hypothetical protein
MKPFVAIAIAIASCVSLAGCAGVLPTGDESQADVPSSTTPIAASMGGPLIRASWPRSSPPNDYRQLAADEVDREFKSISLNGAQISTLREAQATQMGDWVACMRTPATSNEPLAVYFAVLYSEGKVRTVRRAVVIDQCQGAEYGPLPKPKAMRAASEAEKPARAVQRRAATSQAAEPAVQD